MPGFNDSAADDHAVGAWKTPLVRPYTISRGRTHSRRELGPKTRICAVAARGARDGLRPELHDIVLLCRVPASLDEIAAALAIPLCVVDVLVDDLCARGLVTIYQIELAPHGGRHRSTAATVAGGDGGGQGRLDLVGVGPA
jgi:uncharacterized protein DUF742